MSVHRHTSSGAVALAMLVSAAAIAAAPPAGVVIHNPAVLPPAGSQNGWVDFPCSKEVSYQADWPLPDGSRFVGTAVRAKNMIVTDIGNPSMHDEGADVVTTFAAVLYADVTYLLGEPQSHPLQVTLPGQMTVRLIGKAGKTTGAFPATITAMTFSNNSLLVDLDPSKPSTGGITVTDLGAGSWSVECGVEVYSRFSLKPGGAPQWLPMCPDSNAPTHYELRAASCVPPGALIAEFSFAPAAPKAGQAVVFTDLSTGGATSWTWTFGDGTTSSTRYPSHVFAAPGAYPVRLLVTTATASSSKSVSVQIAPAPGPRLPRHLRRASGPPTP